MSAERPLARWPEPDTDHVVDVDGFHHGPPYEEWVGYPMHVCACGHAWPCPTIEAQRLDTPKETPA